MYVKLFSQILTSSIWLESDQTLRVWITLLAAMDQDGFAHFASVRNLAQHARVSDSDCQTAVDVLESPDPDSSDPAHEGRRIERVPGGWLVLNAEKYRELGSLESRREKTAERTREWRKREAASRGSSVDTTSKDCDAPVTHRDANMTHRDAPVTACDVAVIKSDAMQKQKHMQKQKKKQKKSYEGSLESDIGVVGDRSAKPDRRRHAQIPDDAFLDELKTKAAYSQVDVLVELSKAQTWCAVNHRVCSRRFFVNWLNRCEKAMTNEGDTNGTTIRRNTTRVETTYERRERETAEYFASRRDADSIDSVKQIVPRLSIDGNS